MGNQEEKNSGVNIKGGQVNINGDIVGRDKQNYFIVMISPSVVIITLIVVVAFYFLQQTRSSPVTSQPTGIVVQPTLSKPTTQKPETLPPNTALAQSTSTLVVATQIQPTSIPTLSSGATRVALKDNAPQIYIPAGTFKMGSINVETSISNEKPQHTVELDGFWVDKFEVTNALYALCVTAKACASSGIANSQTRVRYYGEAQYANYPMIAVSWEEARKYCEWAGRRLPAEAEWEKAARGTNANVYPWGQLTPTNTIVNFRQNENDTTFVGKYPAGASPYGVLDMAGNVAEWVNDWFDPVYYSSTPPKNPPGPSTGQGRIIRGGAWDDKDDYSLRTTTRASANPVQRYFNIGFRCAQDAK